MSHAGVFPSLGLVQSLIWRLNTSTKPSFITIFPTFFDHILGYQLLTTKTSGFAKHEYLYSHHAIVINDVTDRNDIIIVYDVIQIWCGIIGQHDVER